MNHHVGLKPRFVHVDYDKMILFENKHRGTQKDQPACASTADWVESKATSASSYQETPPTTPRGKTARVHIGRSLYKYKQHGFYDFPIPSRRISTCFLISTQRMSFSRSSSLKDSTLIQSPSTSSAATPSKLLQASGSSDLLAMASRDATKASCM